MSAAVRGLGYLTRVVVRPRRTAREIIADSSIAPACVVVLGFGALTATGFLVSHLMGQYPPPPDELKLWVDTWGEFPMLPFVKVPPEQYRLVEAVAFLPLVLAVWILMAGTARLVAMAFHGRVTFDQYLKLFAASFFVFWILSAVVDMTYSGLLRQFVLAALASQHGPTTRAIVAAFPQVMYPGLLGLGGVYNAIVAHELEDYGPRGAALVGCLTAFWPILLVATLMR